MTKPTTIARPITATASSASCEAKRLRRLARGTNALAIGMALMRPAPRRDVEPIIAAPTASEVACARSNSATRRPSRITSTRSLMPSTSGSSLEIIRIATPSPASSHIRRWISALAPTSMPRVGSSRMQKLRIVGEPLAEHDLLLIAAGKAARDLVDRTAS